jgi:RNA polymerase sigma-70 factor (ECF subfamily)
LIFPRFSAVLARPSEAAVESGSSTCWTLIRQAAAGHEQARAEFGLRYAGAVRSYLAARWQGARLVQELDDAVQDVFVECIRQGGLLERAEDDRPGGFRAFLYGAARHVAQRIERRQALQGTREPTVDADLRHAASRDEALSRVFDRALARSIMREAAERQAVLAAERGEEAQRRVELLRLRFQEGLPIRDIAALWGAEASDVHRQYAKAREEFRTALRDIVLTHQPQAPDDVDRECAQLLALLK